MSATLQKTFLISAAVSGFTPSHQQAFLHTASLPLLLLQGARAVVDFTVLCVPEWGDVAEKGLTAPPIALESACKPAPGSTVLPRVLENTSESVPQLHPGLWRALRH
ncbi:hypothetical protein MHYP_G00176290 [Metynnis hypsauchen]